ncbi:MAG: hypothetical protein JXA13_00745, partial [Anaerolineales bacterium]|nr:hypothetical protein [Anaerolineales bacterium]
GSCEIGNGMEECGCRRLKDRYTQAGIYLNKVSPERLSPVRAAQMSGRFEERWKLACNSPPN